MWWLLLVLLGLYGSVVVYNLVNVIRIAYRSGNYLDVVALCCIPTFMFVIFLLIICLLCTGVV